MHFQHSGTGFTVIPLKSGRYLVQSVPGEISLDQVFNHTHIYQQPVKILFLQLQLSVLEQAEKSRGLVTQQSLGDNLKWDTQRSNIILGMNVVQIFYLIII